MIRWSPVKLKFTLGVGSLGSIAILSELSQKAIPTWLAVGIVILPFAVFVFADPDDLPRSVARFLQVGASLWYLVVNSALVVLSVSGGMKVGWWLMFILMAIGAIPCLIVIGRVVVPPEEPWRETDALLPLDTPMGATAFSEPVVYRPKKGKFFLLLLLCLAFVACGTLMIQQGQWIGWLAVAFFGLGMIVFTVQLLFDASYLRVSSSGIEICGILRKHSYKWSDISHFYAGNIGPNKMVLFDFSATFKQAQMGRAVAKSLTGAEGALPDTYGFTAEALADHLNQWSVAHMPKSDEACPPESGEVS
jgi:hypothetical protein